MPSFSITAHLVLAYYPTVSERGQNDTKERALLPAFFYLESLHPGSKFFAKMIRSKKLVHDL